MSLRSHHRRGTPPVAVVPCTGAALGVALIWVGCAQAQTPPAPAPASAGVETPAPVEVPQPAPQPHTLDVGGYVQVQYERRDDARDERTAGGRSLNTDGFSIRRARLHLAGERGRFGTLFELDAGTRRDVPVTPRRAEGSVTAGEWLRATAGLTRLPFGDELPESNERRVFLERSAGSRALFPGETDVGLRVSGALGPLRYDAAVTNGAPVEDGKLPLGDDPLAAHDWLGRLGFAATTGPLRATGGVSFLTGEGFHAGTAATKAGVSWKDLDEDSVIDAGELTPEPGLAATASESFSRWAVGADAHLTLTTFLGRTELSGEAALASNLDRSAGGADPVLAGFDLRRFGAVVSLLHRCPAGGLVGARWDTFDPNTDLTESRRGDRVPVDATQTTLSGLVGYAFAEDTWRLVLQYDRIDDALARDTLGVPTDLKNDRVTLRLQVAP